MCGIFAYISKNPQTQIDNYDGSYSNFKLLKNRGPDDSQFLIIKNVGLGFHRLRINDLSNAGNQPMEYNGYYLICNGEIFNHEELINKFNFKMSSTSDCEVILHLYNFLINDNSELDKSTIIDKLCNLLNGEFSFILFDSKLDITFVARDPYGVRPLFINKSNNKTNKYLSNESFYFASEIKGMNNIVDSIKQFPPGSFMIIYNKIKMNGININSNKFITITKKYHNIILNKNINEDLLSYNLNKIFREAVYKRMMSDQEICSLLSGGLDSSLVASIVSEKLGPNKLKTFAIGLKGSPDLKFAQIVADHIKSVHHSIELTEKEFLGSIEEVIVAIESYDTTTVRASVGNYLVSKYIKENTDCKVIFNGDYADEVCGGYKYFKKAPSEEDFHNECIRLVDNIHYFDCLRSDRSISNNGLEARVPFADKDFVNYYLSIDAKLRMSNNKIEKYMLRSAFENDNLLPDKVLWRSKEAFSDGVTSKTRSWHKIIQEYVDTQISDEYFEENKDKYTHNTPVLKESFYYREIFEKHYGGFSNVIPYFWMPKWCEETNDPSAREI
jgi:asparagine synthase (glutamine-hydrolysing)